MIKKITKFVDSKRTMQTKGGSSLLVALLVMGLLLTFTLGLSTLVIREIRQTSDIVFAGQAYFAAEAGVENALFELSETLPGFENQVDYPDETKGEEDEDLRYSYEILNKGDTYPYFPDDEPIFLTPEMAVTKNVLYDQDPGNILLDRTYNVLPLNESVTIPLFTSDSNGNVQKIDDFLVQYYVNFEPDDDIERLYIQDANGIKRPISLKDFDIIRWKVFGNPCNGDCNNPNTLVTDAISDFYPAIDGVSEFRPVCIGTLNMLQTEGGKYNCLAPVAPTQVTRVEDFTKLEDIDISAAGYSFARECFLSEVGGDPTIGSLIGEVTMKRCTIDNFIRVHNRNYLTLTNMVNTDIIGINPETTPQFANIYYRIVAKSAGEDRPIVREFADIRSDGYSSNGKIKQSVDVKLRLSSFLPVFNFSLYRTDTSTDDIDSPFKVLDPGFLKMKSPFEALSTI